VFLPAYCGIIYCRNRFLHYFYRLYIAAINYTVCRFLYKAVEDDDVNSLQKCLHGVFDVETKTAVLLAAVRSARHHCIQVLMMAGCDPVLKLNGTSAVHCAIMKNDMKALLHLVDRQLCDVETKPLESNNNCQRLWYDDRQPADEALYIAAGVGNIEAVNMLLNHGANPNCCFYYDDEFLVTCSTLVAACFAPLRHFAPENSVTNAENIVLALVNSEANVNRRCSTGMTPLHWVVKAGLVHSVTLLVKLGADVNAARAGDGITPLMMAVEQDQSVVSALLSAGADIDAIDHAKYTALCHAVKARNLSISEYLLQQGANPDGCAVVTAAVPFLSTTPLYLATSFGNRAMVVLLLKWGANLHLTVGTIPTRSTVFQVALHVNNFELVRVFLAAGIDHTYAYKLVSENIDTICTKLPPQMTHLLSTNDRVRLQSLQKLLFELLQPQTLKQLCRFVIRCYTVDCRQLHKLPLPSALCSFLSFSDL